jgi:hypothetical protein
LIFLHIRKTWPTFLDTANNLKFHTPPELAPKSFIITIRNFSQTSTSIFEIGKIYLYYVCTLRKAETTRELNGSSFSKRDTIFLAYSARYTARVSDLETLRPAKGDDARFFPSMYKMKSIFICGLYVLWCFHRGSGRISRDVENSNFPPVPYANFVVTHVSAFLLCWSSITFICARRIKFKLCFTLLRGGWFRMNFPANQCS